MPRRPERARPRTVASCTQGHAAAAERESRAHHLGGSPRDPGLSVLAPVPTAVRDKLEALGARRIEGVFYRGNGCEECRGTGYRGRIGIFELLPISPELRDLILQKRSNAELKTTAQKTMVTMHQDALQKAAEGITTLEEILRVSSGDLLE